MILLYGLLATKPINNSSIDSLILSFLLDPDFLSKHQFSLYLFFNNIMLFLKLNQSNSPYSYDKLRTIYQWMLCSNAYPHLLKFAKVNYHIKFIKKLLEVFVIC